MYRQLGLWVASPRFLLARLSLAAGEQAAALLHLRLLLSKGVPKVAPPEAFGGNLFLALQQRRRRFDISRLKLFAALGELLQQTAAAALYAAEEGKRRQLQMQSGVASAAMGGGVCERGGQEEAAFVAEGWIFGGAERIETLDLLNGAAKLLFDALDVQLKLLRKLQSQQNNGGEAASGGAGGGAAVDEECRLNSISLQAEACRVLLAALAASFEQLVANTPEVVDLRQVRAAIRLMFPQVPTEAVETQHLYAPHTAAVDKRLLLLLRDAVAICRSCLVEPHGLDAPPADGGALLQSEADKLLPDWLAALLALHARLDAAFVDACRKLLYFSPAAAESAGAQQQQQACMFLAMGQRVRCTPNVQEVHNSREAHTALAKALRADAAAAGATAGVRGGGTRGGRRGAGGAASGVATRGGRNAAPAAAGASARGGGTSLATRQQRRNARSQRGADAASTPHAIQVDRRDTSAGKASLISTAGAAPSSAPAPPAADEAGPGAACGGAAAEGAEEDSSCCVVGARPAAAPPIPQGASVGVGGFSGFEKHTRKAAAAASLCVNTESTQPLAAPCRGAVASQGQTQPAARNAAAPPFNIPSASAALSNTSAAVMAAALKTPTQTSANFASNPTPAAPAATTTPPPSTTAHPMAQAHHAPHVAHATTAAAPALGHAHGVPGGLLSSNKSKGALAQTALGAATLLVGPTPGTTGQALGASLQQPPFPQQLLLHPVQQQQLMQAQKLHKQTLLHAQQQLPPQVLLHAQQQQPAAAAAALSASQQLLLQTQFLQRQQQLLLLQRQQQQLQQQVLLQQQHAPSAHLQQQPGPQSQLLQQQPHPQQHPLLGAQEAGAAPGEKRGAPWGQEASAVPATKQPKCLSSTHASAAHSEATVQQSGASSRSLPLTPPPQGAGAVAGRSGENALPPQQQQKQQQRGAAGAAG